MRLVANRVLNEAALIGWSGMRGIVSLIAALALPFNLPNGMPLEGRDAVIYMTFVVILVTLLLPGLTLASLTRWLNINHQAEYRLEHHLRKALAEMAQCTIQQLHSLKTITHEESTFLQAYFNLQCHVFEIATSPLKKMQNLELLRLKIIQDQRKKLLQMWEQREIDDKLMNKIDHELDVEETLLTRVELG